MKAFLLLIASALTCRAAIDCAFHLAPRSEADATTQTRYIVTDYLLTAGKTYIIETGNNAETWIPIGAPFTAETPRTLQLKFPYYAGGAYFNRQYFRVRAMP